jgi:hypothetical protein
MQRDTPRVRKPMTDAQLQAKREYDHARYLRQRAERDAARPPDVITLLDDVTTAYLAGLTDADGSIFVTHTNRLRTYYPAVCWAMTHLPTVEWVTHTLNATAVTHQSRDQADRRAAAWGKSRFKVQYRTQVTGARAQLLCRRMLPFMQTKQEQALLVVEFPVDERRAPGRRLDDGIRARREELGKAITALNRS